MVGKKAYIRTLEAVIAIVLLLFATYTLTPKVTISPDQVPYVVKAAQQYTILQVTENQGLRQKVLDSDPNNKPGLSFQTANTSLAETVKKRVPPGYDFSTDICSNPTCVTLPELQTSAYMSDTIVSGEDSTGTPVIRLVRVWFWRK